MEYYGGMVTKRFVFKARFPSATPVEIERSELQTKGQRMLVQCWKDERMIGKRDCFLLIQHFLNCYHIVLE